MNEKDRRIFEFNDESGEFQELDIDEDLPLYNLLDSDSILLFIDQKHKRVWMWIGSNSTISMKFRATQASYHIRDRYAFGYKISSIDEGEESKAFKIFVGLEEEEEYIVEKVEPKYKGIQEEEEFFASLDKKDILLIMEKSPVPEGFERRMIIVNNEIYLYKEYSRSLGSNVREKRLFRLKEEIEDGLYLLEEYTPRILFSFNRIVLIDLLQKVGTKSE